MKDEIKEIEKHLKKCSECFTCQYFLGEDEKGGHCKLINILDYITNLQEENKRLKEKKEHLLIDLRGESEYKSRNEKAIEYITSEQSIETFKTIENREDWLKINHNLLNILQGDDKSE